jgi:Ca2+/Na+ antiporter
MSQSWLRQNSLTLFFTGLFLVTVFAQALVGHADYNHQQVAHHDEPISLATFVTSSVFWVDVMENWQSEYLQFFLYVFATVWLVQLGSAESKEAHKTGMESDEEQQVGEHAQEDSPSWVKAGGWRTTVFSRSLGLIMGALFLLTWAASSVAGWSAFNNEQLMGLEDPVSWVGYLGKADFWNRTLQNWQSEMLAVGSMAIFSVYLRQRGSPESKPVGAAHHDTGQTG